MPELKMLCIFSSGEVLSQTSISILFSGEGDGNAVFLSSGDELPELGYKDGDYTLSRDRNREVWSVES
jgi:hypothetical protein